jgi:hypothetical protein
MSENFAAQWPDHVVYRIDWNQLQQNREGRQLSSGAVSMM